MDRAAMPTPSGAKPNIGPLEIYDGPPDYRQTGRHAMSPSFTHDELERLNYLAQMNRHLTTRVLPYVA